MKLLTKYADAFFVVAMVAIILVSLLFLAASLNAQESRGHGYMFVGAGGAVASGSTAGTMHLGIGGEGFLKRGLAVGGELGYLSPTRSFGDGFGVLSGNAAYHFVPARRNNAIVVPFVTGGYSLAFRDGHMNMANFGGGATWWFKQRHGLRFEFRDHYAWQYDQHYLGFRVAWAFR